MPPRAALAFIILLLLLLLFASRIYTTICAAARLLIIARTRYSDNFTENLTCAWRYFIHIAGEKLMGPITQKIRKQKLFCRGICVYVLYLHYLSKEHFGMFSIKNRVEHQPVKRDDSNFFIFKRKENHKLSLRCDIIIIISVALSDISR